MPNNHPSSAVFCTNKKRFKDNSELIEQGRRLNNSTAFPYWRTQERAVNTLQGEMETTSEVNVKITAPSQGYSKSTCKLCLLTALKL